MNCWRTEFFTDMKSFSHRLLVLILVGTALAACCVAWNGLARAAATPGYKLTSTMKLGGEGRWDYATLDAAGKFLYVTRTTHTMVVDAATGKAVHDIAGQVRSHGVALVPAAGRGFISDGKLGAVIVFDLNSGAALGKIPAADDADSIIYDPASNRVLVFCGDAHRMVAIAPDVDPKGGVAAATVDLGGSPEFAVADGRGRVFVNIADKEEVAVVDTKQMKLIARWPTGPGQRPTGMAMDRAARRLFVGCRNQKLVVMNADDGKIVAAFPIGAGVDATAFEDGMVFASCADGTLTIVREESADKFELAQTVQTEMGARTMAVDAHSGTVYLPTADLTIPPSGAGSSAHQRPIPVAGTFRILVVTRSAAGRK
jgi:DNA-binding beta-propeller fold protein YncE